MIEEKDRSPSKKSLISLKRKNKKSEIHGGKSIPEGPLPKAAASTHSLPSMPVKQNIVSKPAGSASTSTSTPADPASPTPPKSSHRNFTLDSDDDDDIVDLFRSSHSNGISREDRLNEVISGLLPPVIKMSPTKRSTASEQVQIKGDEVVPLIASDPSAISDPTFREKNENSSDKEIESRVANEEEKETKNLFEHDDSDKMSTGNSISPNNDNILSFPTTSTAEESQISIEDFLANSDAFMKSRNITPRKRANPDTLVDEDYQLTPKPKRQEIDLGFDYGQAISMSTPLPEINRLHQRSIHSGYFAAEPSSPGAPFTSNKPTLISPPVASSSASSPPDYNSGYEYIQQLEQPSYDEAFDDSLFRSFIVGEGEELESPIYRFHDNLAPNLDNSDVSNTWEVSDDDNDEASSDNDGDDDQTDGKIEKDKKNPKASSIFLTRGLAMLSIVVVVLIIGGLALQAVRLLISGDDQGFFECSSWWPSMGWEKILSAVNYKSSGGDSSTSSSSGNISGSGLKLTMDSINAKIKDISNPFLARIKDIDIINWLNDISSPLLARIEGIIHWLNDICKHKLQNIISTEDGFEYTVSGNILDRGASSTQSTSEYLKEKTWGILSKFQSFSSHSLNMENYVPEWYKKWEQEEIMKTASAVGQTTGSY